MARILMLLDHSFPPDLRVENEAASLSESGHDVTILSIGPDNRPADDQLGRVRIVRDRMPAGIRNKMRGLSGSIPILSHYLAWKAQRIFSTWPFDVLHAHDLYMVGGAILAGRRLGVKVVADLHENWVAALGQYAWSTRYPGRLFIDIGRWERLEKRWLTEVDAVIVVIEEMADRLSTIGIEPNDVAVVPNTIERSRFDAFGTDASITASMRGELTLLYTGGMDLHRGIESALRAMPTVRQRVPGARLVLVGDGAVRESLEALSSRLGVSDCVEFRGWQPQRLIPSYIAGADIGLIPHLKSAHTDHTIPHKLFHYMHMGVPVVASNCGPIERILQSTEAGRIYPSGDSDRMAETILDLAVRRSVRKDLGENGRRAVDKIYNWNRTAEELTALYQRVLS